jgi:transposase
MDPETRAAHDRDDLRYPSDLTDAERLVLGPLLPPPANTGRHRAWQMRELANAIFFVRRGIARGACCRNTVHYTRRCVADSCGFTMMEPGKA